MNNLSSLSTIQVYNTKVLNEVKDNVDRQELEKILAKVMNDLIESKLI